MNRSSPCFALGVSLSTQSCSGVLIDPATGSIPWTESINFEQAFGEQYGLRAGFVEMGNAEVYSVPSMWVHALELLLLSLSRALGKSGMDRIKAIGGAGQQHGTVYLSASGLESLSSFRSPLPMHEQLDERFFSRALSPIWMDSSTSDECRTLAEMAGGADKIAARTGSKPTERFSGPQIMKFARRDPLGWEKTERVFLISSFICSLFTGREAPVDFCDGSGTNLMNISERKWDTEILSALEMKIPGFSKRLPPLAPTLSVAGRVSSYMVERYGFSPETVVLPFSGDNPQSLLGMGVHGTKKDAGSELVLSFGTSDTGFALSSANFDPKDCANVFAAVSGGNMILMCVKNGSLAREHVRDRYIPSRNWTDFSTALSQTSPGNEGRMMLPFFVPEITPNTKGMPLVRYLNGLREDDAAGCMRGVLEAQIFNLERELKRLIPAPRALRCTGGASANESFMQIVADIFDAEVIRDETFNTGLVTDSVSLGSAISAAYILGFPFSELVDIFRKSSSSIRPRSAEVYAGLKPRFASALDAALGGN